MLTYFVSTSCGCHLASYRKYGPPTLASQEWSYLHSGKISIFAEDQAEPISVDCTATIVSSTFEVMDNEGAAMSQLDFGALHYGDDKHLTFSVLNNGPKPARFFAACGTPQQLAEDTDAAAPRDDPMTAFIQVMHNMQTADGVSMYLCADGVSVYLCADVCWRPKHLSCTVFEANTTMHE